MDLIDKVVAGLNEFASQLEHGERITVSTIERCGCIKEPTKLAVISRHQSTCHICGGTGYILGAKTFIGE